MFHYLLIGIVFGLGAAVPVGPVNLEITRRNLQLGSRFGLVFGFGACTADLVYMLLLAAGAITVLQHHLLMQVLGIIGAMILIGFAINAIRAGLQSSPTNTTQAEQTHNHRLWQHYLGGLTMTLVNPMTILFWSSVGTQIAALSRHGHQTAWLVAIGVMFGTASWVIGLNLILALTRHYLSATFMRWLNILGGIILLFFAGFGIWHSLAQYL